MRIVIGIFLTSVVMLATGYTIARWGAQPKIITLQSDLVTAQADLVTAQESYTGAYAKYLETSQALKGEILARQIMRDAATHRLALESYRAEFEKHLGKWR